MKSYFVDLDIVPPSLSQAFLIKTHQNTQNLRSLSWKAIEFNNFDF